MIAIGRADEVRGFALAGVEVAPCRTPHEADALVLALTTDATVGLLMVPSWVEEAARTSIARARGRRPTPAILVLPDA